MTTIDAVCELLNVAYRHHGGIGATNVEILRPMTERIKAKDYRGGLFAGGKKGPQALEPKESGISVAIKHFLDRHNIYNDRINSGQLQVITKYFEKKTQTWKEFKRWVRLAKKGTPDRFAIVCGRIVFVEVKRRGQKPSEDQLERHRELKAAGAEIIVADSLDSFIAQFTAFCSSIAK